MNTIIQSIREKNLLSGFSSSLSLPLSQGQPPQPGLRRRLSSLSLRIQQQVPSPGKSWASFRWETTWVRHFAAKSMHEYTEADVTARQGDRQGSGGRRGGRGYCRGAGSGSGDEPGGRGGREACAVQGQIMKLVGSDNHVALPR